MDNTEPNAEPVANSSKLPWNVKVLGVASLFNDIATEMAYPALKDFLNTLAPGQKWLLGLLEGLADTVAALLKLFAGSWSDRLGSRKGFVLFGYAVAAIARPFIGAATTVWQVVAARTIDRIGKGLRAAPRDALIVDSIGPTQRGRAFGFHRAMDHIGAAIGPLLCAGFLWMFPGHLRELFFLTAIPGLFIIVLIQFGLRSPARQTALGRSVKLSLTPFDARFKRYLIALFFFALANSSDILLLQRGTDLGLTTVDVALLWCAFHIVKAIGNYVCGGLVDRRGPYGLLLGGWVLYAVIYGGFALADAAWQVWLLFGVYAIFYSLAEPAEKTLAAELAAPEQKGLAFGWFNFTLGIGALPANLLTGWLYQTQGPLVAFGAAAALALAAAALLFTIRQAVPYDP